MSFLNPLLLAAGLAALTIPVIVHLQRRRRKVRVVFSSLRLVVQSQRITRRRRRITDWPILLLRMLAVALVAFVFGRPWLQSLASGSLGHKETVVYVLDQSASMHAVGEVGPVWHEAVNAVTRAVGDSHPESRVALMTTPAGDATSQVSWLKPNQLLSRVEDAAPGYGRANLASALNRAGGALNRIDNDLPKVVHLISDLQADAIRNLDRVALPANVAVRVTKVGDLEPYNVGLTAAAKGEGELRRGVYGLQGPEGGITALGNITIQEFGPSGESQGDPRDVTVKANTLTVSQAYAAGQQGWFSRHIKLIQDDALAIDNEVFDAFYVQARVNALLVEPNINAETFNQATFFFSRALDPFLGEADKSKRPTRFVPRTVALRNAPRAVRQLDRVNSVVFLPALNALSGDLSASLRDFVEEGGGLVLFTGEPLRPEIYNQYLGELLPVTIGAPVPVEMRATIEFVSQRHPLWGGLDISNRQKMVRLPLFRRSKTTLADDATMLAKFADGETLVARKRYGQGRVVFVNTSATRQWTDWPAIGGSYVPTIHVLAAHSLPNTEDTQRNANVQLTFADVLSFEIGQKLAGRNVQLDQQEFQVDEDGNITKSFPPKPGIYSVLADNEIIKKFAVNLDSRESNLESTQSVVVKRQLEAQRSQAEVASLAARDSDKNDAMIWKTMLAMLAIVLAVEPLLANLAGR